MPAAEVAQKMLLDVLDVSRTLSKVCGAVAQKRRAQALGHTGHRPLRADRVGADRLRHGIDQQSVVVHEEVNVQNRGVGSAVPFN